MISAQHRTRPRVWAFAVTFALLFHIGVALAARLLQPPSPAQPPAAEQPVIEVVFAPEPEPAADEPSLFTELPPDRADERPESPDFLSNVDGRARDDVPGGTEESLPRLEGRSETPQVRMDPEAAQRPEPSSEKTTPGGVEEAGPSAAQEEADSEAEEPVPGRIDDPGDLFAESAPREAPVPFDETKIDTRQHDPLRDLRREKADVAGGTSDIFQEAMDNPEGNALLREGISLNTMAWDYAPWLQQFRRDLLERWRAPYAYYLGVIDGWTVVELEIAPGGDVLQMQVLEEAGHESLRSSSLGALRSAMPYAPLPNDFPEDKLILRIKLNYPKRER